MSSSPSTGTFSHLENRGRALGVVPIAAWLVKEHYGDANSWQNLDVDVSFADPAASNVLIGGSHSCVILRLAQQCAGLS
jgi:hypothetical protein